MNNRAFDQLIDWAPAGFSAVLIGLCRLSLQMQETVPAECKSDGTLVTPADTRIEDLLTTFLHANDPESFVIGEETLAKKGSDYLSQAMKGKTWVIDPIDGTALYAVGIDGWGISIGLMNAGTLQHGVVAYPYPSVTGSGVEFVFSSGDAVLQSEAALDGGDAGVVQALVEAKRPLVVKPPIPGYAGMFACSQRMAKSGSYRGSHALVSFASAVQTFRCLMRGMFSAYLVKLKLWDIAGVFPLAWRLGIRASTPQGTPIGLEVLGEIWKIDPADAGFLTSRDHILFYRPERIDMSIWNDITLPSL